MTPATGAAPSAFLIKLVVVSVVVAAKVWITWKPVPSKLMRKTVPRPFAPPADAVP